MANGEKMVRQSDSSTAEIIIMARQKDVFATQIGLDIDQTMHARTLHRRTLRKIIDAVT
jgi:hypothetical protein